MYMSELTVRYSQNLLSISQTFKLYKFKLILNINFCFLLRLIRNTKKRILFEI